MKLYSRENLANFQGQGLKAVRNKKFESVVKDLDVPR